MIYYAGDMGASDPRTRVRQRIKQLLENRGMTQRAFAKAMGHGDQWASNFLHGEFALSLDQLDTAAAALGVPPGELVRRQDDSWELSPTEMRVIRALRMLPPPVRDHLAMTMDYTVGMWPDEADIILSLRGLEDDDLKVIRHWIDMKRLERAHARGAARRDVPLELDVLPDGRSPRTRAGPPKKKTRTG